MRNRFSTLALAAVLTAGASGIALAQTCPPGYAFDGAYCRPGAPGYSYAPSNPVSGAVSGEVAGAAAGGATGGPVGAVVGGALGLAAGTVAGTANAVAGAPVYGSSYPPPAPACPPGYVMYSTGCFPGR
jgi:hypothetical protein